MLTACRTTARTIAVSCFATLMASSASLAWATTPSVQIQSSTPAPAEPVTLEVSPGIQLGIAGETAMLEAARYLQRAYVEPQRGEHWANMARVELGIAARQVGSPLARLLIDRATGHVDRFREHPAAWDLEDASLMIRRALDTERHDFKVHANTVTIKRDFHGFHVQTELPPAEVEYSLPVSHTVTGSAYYNPRASYGYPRPTLWYSFW